MGLCGHATLATAAVILAGTDADVVEFDTRSGRLRVGRGEDGLLVMDFPSRPAQPVDAPRGLLEALGLQPGDVVALGGNDDDYLVELSDAAAVAAVHPDFAALAEIPTRGVAVAALAEEPYDVVSRFFAPAVGVDEDPVTGSAHTMIGPWFADRMGPKLRCRQISGRGGDLQVELDGDRLHIAGRAFEVGRYALTMDAVECLQTIPAGMGGSGPG